MGGGVPQLRYVIVVDRGELIEASMSVRVRANERVRVLSVPGCLPRYLRLIITLFFRISRICEHHDYPHPHQTMDGLRAYGWRERGSGEREAMQVA